MYAETLQSEKLYNKVTADVKVTDADIQSYYAAHKSDYSQAASRDVGHVSELGSGPFHGLPGGFADLGMPAENPGRGRA